MTLIDMQVGRCYRPMSNRLCTELSLWTDIA